MTYAIWCLPIPFCSGKPINKLIYLSLFWNKVSRKLTIFEKCQNEIIERLINQEKQSKLNCNKWAMRFLNWEYLIWLKTHPSHQNMYDLHTKTTNMQPFDDKYTWWAKLNDVKNETRTQIKRSKLRNANVVPYSNYECTTNIQVHN